MVLKNHQAMIRKLKKQVTQLQRKEEASRNKLQKAIVKVKKLSRRYKKTIARKNKEAKAIRAAAETAAILKVAASVSHQMKKRALEKEKAISKAVANYEKKFAAKLKKSITKKAKKVKR